ncbi:antirepressor [Gordonia phage Bantam]|uniref:Antirepressor n=1 Tax=Gordonia phage Bantam TaxID=1887641 RepID=A0A1B3AYE8_9CAUD|nr:HTH DNA binding protein [Gordonia phage Bantam]AOE43778.1 antirepressor [Gordonia phage Bantam]
MITLTTRVAVTAIDTALNHTAMITDIATLSGLSVASIERIYDGRIGDVDDAVADRIEDACARWMVYHGDDEGRGDIDDDRKAAISQHIRTLLDDCGYDLTQLCDLSGADRCLIRHIRDGRLGRTMREVIADRLEAIPADLRRKIATPLGTTRRLQALVRWGYTPAMLADELGVSESVVDEMLVGADEVLPSVARAIHPLFSRLEQIPGPSDEARDMAKAAGWLLPLQYDEYTIDRLRTAVSKEYRPPRHEVDPERHQDVWNREVEQLAELLTAAA